MTDKTDIEMALDIHRLVSDLNAKIEAAAERGIKTELRFIEVSAAATFERKYIQARTFRALTAADVMP